MRLLSFLRTKRPEETRERPDASTSTETLLPQVPPPAPLDERGQLDDKTREHFRSCGDILTLGEYQRQVSIADRVLEAHTTVRRSRLTTDTDHRPGLAGLLVEGADLEILTGLYAQVMSSGQFATRRQAPAILRIHLKHPEQDLSKLLELHLDIPDPGAMLRVIEKHCSKHEAIAYMNELRRSEKLQIKINAPALTGIGLATGRNPDEMLVFHNAAHNHDLALVMLAACRGSSAGIEEEYQAIYRAPQVSPYFEHAPQICLLRGLYDLRAELVLAHYAYLREMLPPGYKDAATGLLSKTLALCASEARKARDGMDVAPESAAMFNATSALAWDLLDNGALDASGLVIGGIM